MRKLGTVVGLTLLCLVVADLIGVAMCFFFEVFGGRGSSAALYYTIWFVLGIFCGLFINTIAGNAIAAVGKDWVNEPDVRTTAWFLFPAAMSILAALSVGFYLSDWRYDRADSVYVPDSESHTLTFFITIFLSMIFFFRTLRPLAKKKAKRVRSK